MFLWSKSTARYDLSSCTFSLFYWQFSDIYKQGSVWSSSATSPFGHSVILPGRTPPWIKRKVVDIRDVSWSARDHVTTSRHYSGRSAVLCRSKLSISAMMSPGYSFRVLIKWLYLTWSSSVINSLLNGSDLHIQAFRTVQSNGGAVFQRWCIANESPT